MDFKTILFTIYLTSTFFGYSAADEYFELFAGTNVWARTSFRIRRFVSVEECARRCIETYGCTSFVYSRGTRYCYGRKNVDNKHRRHWHRNRRYDYYNRLTGSDREQIENFIPDSGNTTIVFVRRQPGLQSAYLPGEYSQLDEVNVYQDRFVPIYPSIPTTATTTTTQWTRPTTTTRRYRPRRPPPTTATTTTRRPRVRTRPTVVFRTRPTSIVRRPVPTVPLSRRTYSSTIKSTTTTRPTTTTRQYRPRPRRPRPTTTTRPPRLMTPASRRRTYPTRRTPATTKRTTTALTAELQCVEKAIGLEDGTFPMNRVSASSSYWRFVPTNSAINSGNGWMASTTNIGEYLEIDFGEPKTIVAVATQGSTYFLLSEYVSKYKIKFLLHEDGIFETYKENGQERIFSGNDDANTIIKHQLRMPVRAHKIQFHPIDFLKNIMMRVEVFEQC